MSALVRVGERRTARARARRTRPRCRRTARETARRRPGSAAGTARAARLLAARPLEEWSGHVGRSRYRIIREHVHPQDRAHGTSRAAQSAHGRWTRPSSRRRRSRSSSTTCSRRWTHTTESAWPRRRCTRACAWSSSGSAAGAASEQPATATGGDEGKDASLRVIPFINPEIKPIGRETGEDWEGCLSLPGLRGRVRRPNEVKITALDRKGHRFELHLHGYPARVTPARGGPPRRRPVRGSHEVVRDADVSGGVRPVLGEGLIVRALPARRDDRLQKTRMRQRSGRIDWLGSRARRRRAAVPGGGVRHLRNRRRRLLAWGPSGSAPQACGARCSSQP